MPHRNEQLCALTLTRLRMREPFTEPGALDEITRYYMLVIRSFAAARNSPSFLESPRCWPWLLQNTATMERLPEILAWVATGTSHTFMINARVAHVPPVVAQLQRAFGEGTRVKGCFCNTKRECNLVVALPTSATLNDILCVCNDLCRDRCTVLAVPDNHSERIDHCCFPEMLKLTTAAARQEYTRFQIDALGATRLEAPVAARA